LIRPLWTNTEPEALLLRLTYRVSVDAKATPPVATVTMALLRTWQQQTDQVEFPVDIPRFPGPFVPP
jgi:hypothetical protein